MSYLVLARKWRPMTFDDLVGQEHVSRTLSNAITSGRIAHAFLFTGVRGVGKTTSARILAKSLNCEQGPTPQPCLQCGPCRDIANSTDIDVLEIDGASYNGVDEVRRLQESLPYRPSRDRFKIVIVDEVHMLTQSAWNAFLKTLEEPPPHVKFIFATTEVHKVPITILSRCQRYDFRLIPAMTIARRLRYVLDNEHIEADEAALTLLAREAAGSMRDAMSLLDQAIAWGGNRLIGEEIAQVLGVAGRSVLHELASALVRGDAAACLELIGRLAEQGYDLVQLARDSLEHLRDLVVVKVSKEPERIVELTAEELQAVRELVQQAQLDDLLRLHHGFSRGFDQVVHAPNQRAALEMLLVRLAQRPPLTPIDDLLGKLADLERRLGSRGSSSGPAPSRGPGRPVRSELAPAAAAAAYAMPSMVEAAPAPAPKAHVAQVAAPRVEARVQVPAAAPVQAPSVPAQAPQEAMEAWRKILELMRQEHAVLASVLEHAMPLEVTPQGLRLGIEPGSFFETQMRDERAVDLLTRVVRRHFGAPTAVSITLDAKAGADRGTVYEVEEAERRAQERAERAALEQHPLVQAAVRDLGARIVGIRLGSSKR